jgi:hypothetical protein
VDEREPSRRASCCDEATTTCAHIENQRVMASVDALWECLQVKLLVERAYRRAKDLVQSNIDVLHNVAAVLMEKENIDGDEFQKIIMASSAKQYLKDDAPGITIPYQA